MAEPGRISDCCSKEILTRDAAIRLSGPEPCSGSLSPSLTVTFTCSCDGIKGAQDLKISHAHSLILSLALHATAADLSVAENGRYETACG